MHAHAAILPFCLGIPGQYEQLGAFSPCYLESSCSSIVLHFFIPAFSTAHTEVIRAHNAAYKGKGQNLERKVGCPRCGHMAALRESQNGIRPLQTSLGHLLPCTCLHGFHVKDVGDGWVREELSNEEVLCASFSIVRSYLPCLLSSWRQSRGTVPEKSLLNMTL